jgi:hypothetical protein
MTPEEKLKHYKSKLGEEVVEVQVFRVLGIEMDIIYRTSDPRALEMFKEISFKDDNGFIDLKK